MMVEFLPFLLILLGWEAASPQETMVLGVELAPDEATCRQQGELLIEDRRALPDGPDRGVRYFCVPAPSAEDYDRAFEQVR